mgnify:CR=1 FL=1
MDANGSRFWSLHAPAHWPTLGQGLGHVRWHGDCSRTKVAN